MLHMNPVLSSGLLVLFVASPCWAQDDAERQPPRALLAFREARRQIVSGRVEWTAELPDRGRTMHYVSRYAGNGDVIFENRGDEDGWTCFESTGRGASKFPELYLASQGTTWKYKDTTGNATVWPPGSPKTSQRPELKDARAIGIFSTSESVDTPLASRGAWESRSDPVMSYEERREGDLVVVTGEHRSGSITEWKLAPEMGWNAVSVVSESPDGARTSVENELRQFGDVWLPRETIYRRNGAVEAIVSIASARLNQPDDPGSFTPNDIGLGVGINLSVQTDKPGTRVKMWNGEEISDADRYHREVELGLLTPGEVMRGISERGYWDSPYLAPEERRFRQLSAAKRTMQESVRSYQALWRRYVKSFIKRYELNDEQQQKARGVLAECERSAEPIAEKLERRWGEHRVKLKEAVGASDAKRAKKLRDEWRKHQEPLGNIFKERLVPALDRLPTRAQRKAAEAKAAP